MTDDRGLVRRSVGCEPVVQSAPPVAARRPLSHRLPIRLAIAGLVGLVVLSSAIPAPTPPYSQGSGAAVAPAEGSKGFALRGPSATPTGPSWTNVSGTSAGGLPSDLVGSLAYDAADGYLLFFGLARESDGYAGPAQTWTFANGNWTNVTTNLTNSPSPRFGAGLTYDAADGYLVLFGGFDPVGPLTNASGLGHPTDTWTFRGGQWTDRTPTAGAAPPPEFGPAMTYDASAGLVLLAAFNRSASTGGDTVFETWTYLAGRWTHVPNAPGPLPGGREQASLAYDPADHESVLFGGTYVANNASTGLVYNDTWVYHGGAWTNATVLGAPSPFPSERAAMSPSPGGHPVLIGGYDPTACQYGNAGGCTPNSTWLFDNGTWNDLGVLAPVAPPLGAAQQDSLAWDPAIGATVLVGDQGSGVWWFRWNASAPVAVVTPHGTGAAPGGSLNLTLLPLGGSPPYGLTLCSGGAPCTNRSGVAGSGPEFWQAPFPAAGSQTVSVRVTDENGSIGVNGIVVPVYASNGTLTATLAVAPAAGFVPLAATIWVNVSGGAPPLTTAIEFGDGGNGSFPAGASPFQHSYGCGPVSTGAYFSACTYTLTATVTDAVGATVHLSQEVEACATNQPGETCLPASTGPAAGGGAGGGPFPDSAPYLGAYGLLGASGGLAALGIRRERRWKELGEAEQLRGALLEVPERMGAERPRP